MSRTRRPRTATTTIAFTMLLATALVAPGAAATGYLVNAELGSLLTVKSGTNAFGGQGDTLDVGYQNHQCTDEDDVVDVGIQNTEGDPDECANWGSEELCKSEEGHHATVISSDRLGLHHGIDHATIDDAIVPILGDDPEDREASCGDDGDTVDVGVQNQEGGHPASCQEWQWHRQEDYQEPGWDPAGDDEDAVDVGVQNHECGDEDDAVDVGIANCEVFDESDGIDAGVFNTEWYDADDTFDASIANTEISPGPDGNRLSLFSGGAPLLLGCFYDGPR